MTDEMPGYDEQHDIVRRQSFELDGLAELDVALGAGRLRVQLSDEPGVHVEVRPDPAGESPWAQGLSGIMNWVGQQFGGGRFDPAQFDPAQFDPAQFDPAQFDPAQFGMGRDFVTGFGKRGFGFGPGGFGPGGFGPDGFGPFGPGGLADDEADDDEDAGDEAGEGRRPRQPYQGGAWGYGWPGMAPGEAVRQMRIEQSGKRVVVHAAQGGPLGMVPLAVTVQAPAGSLLGVRGGTADVLVTGRAGRVQVQSGTGDVVLDQAEGPVRVQTGSGAMRLGPMPAGVTARSGSGDIELASVGEASSVATSSGAVRIGVVAADLTARTGSGDLTVSEAVRGKVQLVTGSGEIRVGVRTGVGAAIDLSSRTGEARSELPVSETPPENGEPDLTVRGRTGSGDALVTAALSTADA